MVSQYTTLPLFGVTTTSPGSLPTDLAANAPRGKGCVGPLGGKGNLNEKSSFVDGVVADEL